MAKNRVAVLVVEDIPQVRATAVRILRELGWRVFDAYNGSTALEILRGHGEIGILFTDVRMPGMSGIELAEAARHLRPTLKVVLTSGYVREEDLPGDLRFVPKPWRSEDIAAAIAAA
jgi:CheY-like chemotaxis protein